MINVERSSSSSWSYSKLPKRTPKFWQLVDLIQAEAKKTGEVPIPLLRALVLLGNPRKCASQKGRNLKPKSLLNKLKNTSLHSEAAEIEKEVCKTGSVQKAANALGISKATAYRRLELTKQ